MEHRPIISLCGEELHPDPLGGLYWPARKILIVSDLHFEKGSYFASRGALLPPYDTKATIARLKSLITRYNPERVISLGDAFHDVGAEARMDEEDFAALQSLNLASDWIWILGNHDPEPPESFPGQALWQVKIGPFTFIHEPTIGAERQISGHLHPCARISLEGRRLRRPCFAVGDDRLIMPALGTYTGGLNILDSAFCGLWRTSRSGPTAYVMGDQGVFAVAGANLIADPPRREQGQPNKRAG